jgi:Lrp/AsnC family leucine-responsive transcriptional regulator
MAKAIKDESTTGTFSLDEKDLKILRVLQQNARATVKEIADKVHLSTTPVHERIKRMEEGRDQAICQHCSISKVKKRVDGDLLCFAQTTQQKCRRKFIKSIQEMHEVIECYNISASLILC